MNYKIVARYIKDLNFEIPNPKIFFLLEKNISNYKINIDIKSHQFKDRIIDVIIFVSAGLALGLVVLNNFVDIRCLQNCM